MLDQGRVAKVERDLAWVEFAPTSSCASCGACHMAASGRMVLEAENPVGAKVGDLIEVEISSAAKVLGPLLVFGVPILFLIFGIVLGSLISENIGIVLGVVFLVIGFLSLRLIDRYVARQKKFRNRIVRILLGKGVKAMTKDPVCGMEVEEGKICSEYKEKMYYFCSETCKTTFEQDPEKYAQKRE